MVENPPEILNKPIEWSTPEAVKPEYVPSSQTVASANLSRRSDAAGLEPAQKSPDARCLWCGRVFTPRATGGSVQKFCCTAHRQQFWIAARRWTMRAIDAGLLSVDCLKASTRACTLAEGLSAPRGRSSEDKALLRALSVGYAGLEPNPNFLSQELRNRSFANLAGVIREIDIWRVRGVDGQPVR
jgi:hypothetical protein